MSTSAITLKIGNRKETGVSTGRNVEISTDLFTADEQRGGGDTVHFAEALQKIQIRSRNVDNSG